MQGGGSFGDIWEDAQDFRLRVVRKYKKNKIIVLPQSVHYNNSALMQRHMEEFNQHHLLYICVRDTTSFENLKKFFDSGRLLLVPDMALYLEGITTTQKNNKSNRSTLYIRRTDREFSGSIIVPTEVETKDWPSFKIKSPSIYMFRLLLRISRELHLRGSTLADKTLDFYYEQVMKKFLIQTGVNFISQYDTIITSRLHGMILAYLLGKQVYFTDNSTGKLSAFYNTWLRDCDKIRKYN